MATSLDLNGVDILPFIMVNALNCFPSSIANMMVIHVLKSSPKPKISKVAKMNSKLTESKAFSKSQSSMIPGKLFTFALLNKSNVFLVHSEMKRPGTYAFCTCPNNLSIVGLSLDASVEEIRLYRVSNNVRGLQFEINLLSLSSFGIKAIIPSLTVRGSSLFSKISCIAPNTITFKNFQKTL